MIFSSFFCSLWSSFLARLWTAPEMKHNWATVCRHTQSMAFCERTSCICFSFQSFRTIGFSPFEYIIMAWKSFWIVSSKRSDKEAKNGCWRKRYRKKCPTHTKNCVYLHSLFQFSSFARENISPLENKLFFARAHFVLYIFCNMK